MGKFFQMDNIEFPQNHIYAIGTVLLWLAKSKSPNRDRDQMLENLMSEMMNTSPTDRPTMEIVSQVC